MTIDILNQALRIEERNLLSPDDLVRTKEQLTAELAGKALRETAYVSAIKLRDRKIIVQPRVEGEGYTAYLTLNCKRHGDPQIGRGTKGSIRLAVDLDTGTEYVVKTDGKQAGHYLSRPEINQKLKRINPLRGTPHLAPILATATEMKGRTLIFKTIMPLYPQTLELFLKNEAHSEKQRLCVLIDCIEGIHQIHERGLSHGDIHIGNFLVAGTGADHDPFHGVVIDYDSPTAVRREVETRRFIALIRSTLSLLGCRFEIPDSSDLSGTLEILRRSLAEGSDSRTVSPPAAAAAESKETAATPPIGESKEREKSPAEDKPVTPPSAVAAPSAPLGGRVLGRLDPSRLAAFQ